VLTLSAKTCRSKYQSMVLLSAAPQLEPTIKNAGKTSDPFTEY
jgi:hypothetical protein